MALYKGFNLYLVNGSIFIESNIIANIGRCILTILQSDGNTPSTFYASNVRDFTYAPVSDDTATLFTYQFRNEVASYPMYEDVLSVFNGTLTIKLDNNLIGTDTYLFFVNETGYKIRVGSIRANSTGSSSLVAIDNNNNVIGEIPGNFSYATGSTITINFSLAPYVLDINGNDVLSINGYIYYTTIDGASGLTTCNRYNYTPYVNNLITLLNNTEQYIPETDPYSGSGDSTTGGGDGTFDGSSDPVPVPSLPSVGAQDAGFITLFAPTASQLKALADYMWSSAFDIEGGGTAIAFKKLFNDPMDCILGLSVVPCAVPTSGAREITVGNLLTTVSMNVASQQYISVDCGTVSFANKYFGSYLDYEPYTKIALFLPYCGTHQISADDIMGKTIGIVYHIDILTGSCIAFVKCGDSVLYEFNGACASNIPVNSLNYSSTIENSIRIAVNIGTTVATAGAAAPATGAASAVRERAKNVGRGFSLAGSTAEGALSLKPSISRSGALGGSVGLLGNQIPYFIITRPRLCKPANQDFFEGYPSFIQTTIGDLIGKGFTSFTNVIIAGQYLTDDEIGELEGILKEGVYL